MATDPLTVPDWLLTKCELWRQRLRMQEWDVELRMSVMPNGDPNVRAVVHPWPDINHGRITFRVDMQDDEDAERVIVHELLHIKHARIDDVIDRVIETQMGISTALVQNVYRRAMEPFVDSLAKILVRLANGD